MTPAFQILLIVQIASIIVLGAEAVFILSNLRTRLQGILLLSVVATLVNNAGYLEQMVAKSAEGYSIALKLSYLGRVWIPYFLFIFALNLCGVRYRRRLTISLALLHVATLVMVFTWEQHSIYYVNVRYVEEGLFAHLTSTPGPWHTFYSVLMISYIVSGLTILIIYSRRERESIVRQRLYTITLSVVVESIFFILGLCGIGGTYDITMMGYAIGAVIMGIGLFKYDIMGTMELGKDFCLDEIPEAVIILNPLGLLEYANSKAMEVLGLDLNGEPSVAQVREMVDLLESHLDSDKKLTLGERTFSLEKKELTHNGSFRGIVYVCEDDTALYNYMDALKVEREKAEKARDEAEAANQSKSAFLSVVSHEIRTPMNAVVGMTELLLRDSDQLNETQEKYLKNIKNSGSALVMIVNDILDQSKIEAGKMEIVEDDYELRPMLEDVRMIVENRIGAKPIDLEIEVGEGVPDYLVGDSLRIRQILLNLMNNASKFTEQGFIKVIIQCIETRGDKKAIKFTVKDSGQGIKPEDLSKLGQAFSQVDTKKNHSKEGTGLGLSISKDFIKLMGGQLEVSSVYGEGSSFFFTIWQGISKGVKAEASAKQAWQAEQSFTCPKARILFVDDTDINLLIGKEMLKPLHATIDTVGSGDKAIELMKENKYDIVFMDYMMPYMDGVETTQKIRGMGYTTPIIALSGDSSDTTRDKFKKAGIDDYMEKPVNRIALKAQLVKWLPPELIEGTQQ